MILGQETPQECQNDSLKSYHHARKSCTSHEMKRYDRGVSPQGNGNCEAGSKAGMSYEFMHRAHRASTEGRKMGGSVGVWGTPVVYRGGWPVDCASCLYALIPYPRRGPLCVVHAAGQGTGSSSSSCLRIFSALDGWEDVRDPVLLVDTSELF